MSRTATKEAKIFLKSVVNPATEKPKETTRDFIEQIVVAIILAVLIRGFDAEAFVIPTGSMADTLLGYHYKVKCEQCGYPNLVNAKEGEVPDRATWPAFIRCQCVNCKHINVLPLNPGKGARREAP